MSNCLKIVYTGGMVEAFLEKNNLLIRVQMFSLHEKVVYPGHGVAKVNRIIERTIAGKKTNFFELTFLNKEMTILVPVSNIVNVGIRRLSSQKSIADLLDAIAQPCNTPHEQTMINWNKRHKGYLEIIRKGNLTQISVIYRDLKHIEMHKELSFGEKNLLTQTEDLLVQEIALVSNLTTQAATEQLRALVSPLLTRASVTVTTV